MRWQPERPSAARTDGRSARVPLDAALSPPSSARRGFASTARRFGTAGALATFVLCIASSAFVVTMQMRPVVRPPPSTTRADAIVVFAGGGGERLAQALELAEAGLAPRVVASVGKGAWPGREAILSLCRSRPDGYRADCIEANPDDTAGEAAAFSEFARMEGLSSLIAVTSDYHLARATLRLDECFPGKIRGAGTPEGKRGLRFFVHEFGGLVEALLLERHCVRRPTWRTVDLVG